MLGALELLVLTAVFGWPVRVRAEEPRGDRYVWAVKGWAASKRVRDAVIAALRSGAEPEAAVGPDAVLIARRAPGPRP